MTIRFYFDYISPYAYIAWTQIHALAQKHGRTVEPIPVLFAAMLNANDTRGPAEIPAKRVYVFKDVFRTGKMLDIPMAPPPTHPFNPLLALRLSCLPTSPETHRALIDALFAAVWGGGQGVSNRDAVAPIAERLGLSIDAVSDPAVKATLRRNTEEAIAAGVFGVPTMIVDGELFWGYDSFVHLDRFLSGIGHLDEAVVAAIHSLPASAQRK